MQRLLELKPRSCIQEGSKNSEQTVGHYTTHPTVGRFWGYHTKREGLRNRKVREEEEKSGEEKEKSESGVGGGGGGRDRRCSMRVAGVRTTCLTLEDAGHGRHDSLDFRME